MNVRAHRLVERADRSFEHRAVRHDVVAHPAVDSSDGYDGGRLQEVDLATRYGLQSEHDLRRDHDWVDAIPRQRTMRLPPMHHNLEPVRARHERAGAIVHGAHLVREHMQAEYGVDLRIV